MPDLHSPNVETYRNLVTKYFSPEAVDQALMLMWYESRGRPTAATTRGARGLYGFDTSRWADRLAAARAYYRTRGISLSDDITDPETNVAVAAHVARTEGWGAWSSAQPGRPASPGSHGPNTVWTGTTYANRGGGQVALSDVPAGGFGVQPTGAPEIPQASPSYEPRTAAMDLLELLSSKIAGGTRAPIESFVVEQADLAPPEGEPDLDPTFGPSDGSEPQPTPFMLGQEVGRELTRAQTAQPGVFGHPLSPDIVPSGTGLFGQPRNRGDRIDKHEGIDLSAPHGTPFTAMGAGIVVRAGVSDGYGGNVIEIDHGDGWTSLYYHNAENLVTAGTRVPAGAQIGLVGATGNADSPHIHLEMRHNGVPVDPMTVIGQQPYDNRPTKPLPEGLD